MDYRTRFLRGASALFAVSTLVLTACNSDSSTGSSGSNETQTSAPTSDSTPSDSSTNTEDDARKHPRPTPTPSATPSPSPTVTPKPSPTPSPTGTPKPSPSPSASATPSPSPSPSSGPSGTPVFSDNFTSEAHNTCFADGKTFGSWKTGYTGYGCNSIITLPDGTSALSIQPQVSTNASETHAGLVLGPIMNGDHIYQVQAKTVKQIRTGSAANTWEVFWILWNYTDDNHFYSLLLKPNGWELGKEDPAYPGAQRYLATGSSPTFPIGQWYTVKIQQTGNTIKAWVNDKLLVTYTDTATPYYSGSLGLYNEDSLTYFQNPVIW